MKISLFFVRLSVLATLLIPVAPLPAQTGTGIPINPPELQSGGAWRITWATQAGERYVLQRSRNMVLWTDVGTVNATGSTANLTDNGVSANRQTYWRVLKVPSGPDTTAPAVSIISAKFVTQGGNTALELTVTATDNIGVVAVNYLEGAVQLGAATAGPLQTWKRIVPITAGDTNPRQFRASASDAAGNSGQSPSFTFVPGASAPKFLPIAGDGSPQSQGVLGLDANGNLLPFTYSPGGNGGNSPQGSLQFLFPEGGRVIQVNGRDTIEANHLMLEFGPDSPLQLSDGPIDVDLPAGQNARVSLGELTVTELLTSLGRPTGSGLDVTLFGKFHLRLLEGRITESGIVAPKWDFSPLGLPLPDVVLPWAEGLADLSTGNEAVFPIAGEIPLFGPGDADGPKLVIGRDRPLELRLRPDGSIALKGRADLTFPGGARFGVEVSLDDPNYCFTLRAESLTLPLASSLANLLPGNPAGCVPVQAQPIAMDSADVCLRAYLRAYRLFAREAEALRPLGPEDGFRRQPSNPEGAASAIADALVASLAAPVVVAVPMQPLRDLATYLNGTAANSMDSVEPAEVLAALQRLKTALSIAGQNPPADVQAELTAAANAAARTIIRHAQDGVRAGSLPAIQRALTNLSEVQLAVGSLLDAELSAGVTTARTNLATQWISQFALPLGITAGTTQLTAELNALDRFTALQKVRDLLSFQGATQAAQLNTFPGSTLVNPCERLLLLRAFAAVQAQLTDHLAQENVPASLLDLADLTDLLADAQLLSQTDPAFPQISAISTHLVSISALIDRELTLPRGQRTYFDLAAKTKALLAAAKVLPASIPAAQASMQRLHTELGNVLTAQLNSEVAMAGLDAAQLAQLLEAGAVYMRLGTRFSLTNTVPWEGQHLVNVVGLLAASTESEISWTQLHDATLFLLDEANQIKNSPVQTPATPAARRLYQVQAARLLDSLRAAAMKVWSLSAAERAKQPPASLADALLPGDLKIDRAAGSFCFNRLTGAFEGTFGGQVRLPKFNGSLTISSGRIGSNGDFEIEAFGHLDFPPPPKGGAAFVTADIPATAPLKFSYSAAEGLRFRGSMRVSMSNGVSFSASAAFLDPVYALRFEATGLNFDVIKAISSALPGFPAANSGAAMAFDESELGRWAGLYTGFGGSAGDVFARAGGAARDAGTAGVPDSDATYEALVGWLAARELTGAGPPDAEVREKVTAYFEDLLRQLIAQNQLIEQLGADPFGASGGAFARGKNLTPRDPSPPGMAAQFDFGPGTEFQFAGPGHATGDIPAAMLTWNYRSADAASGLVKADGSAFTGAGIDFGKFPLLDDRNIDWAAGISTFVSTLQVSSIFQDGVTSFDSFVNTDNTGVALRVTGLQAGAWRVFVPCSRMPFRVVNNAVDHTPGQLIRAGRERPSSPAAERLALQMPVSLEQVNASTDPWVAGGNYATWLVDLEAGDNLVITTIGNGLRRTGLLQGLQIVRVPVEIPEFTATPVSPLEGLSRGTPVTLKWRVKNASSYEIEPGIGPQRGDQGSIVINATQSTQYILTARSASGEVSAVANVVIAGEADTKGLEKALEDIGKKLVGLGDVLASPQFQNGPVDTAKLEKFFCDPAAEDFGDIIRQRLLGNASLKQDFGAVKRAIKTGIAVQASASMFGVDCLNSLLDEIVAFVDEGIEIQERRIGKNPNGSVDLTKVATFSAKESRSLITEMLDVYADAAQIGSERFIQDALLVAHGMNSRAKLLAEIGYQPGPPPVFQLDDMEPEDVYRVGFALQDNEIAVDFVDEHQPKVDAAVFGKLGQEIELWTHAELSVTPRDQWRGLQIWLERALDAENWRERGGAPAGFPTDVPFFAKFAMNSLKAEGERMPDADALRLLKSLTRLSAGRTTGEPPFVQPDAEMKAAWQDIMNGFLHFMSLRVDEPMDTDDELLRAGSLADELKKLGVLVQGFRRLNPSLSIPAAQEAGAQLKRLSDAFQATARSKDQTYKQQNNNKARAQLMELRGGVTVKIAAAAEALNVNLNPSQFKVRGGAEIDTPMRESLRAALAAMSADAAEIAAAIAAESTPDGEGDFGVPGGLAIERLGGSLYYNRDTGYLRGGLTGRLTAPGTDFFLDVREATLDSNGAYALDLTTGGAVPLGGSSKLLFDVDTLTANGTAQGQFAFSGAATLSYDASPATGDEFSFDVNTSFDSVSGEVVIGAGVNTPLKFGDDVVLLDGSVEVDFSTTHPEGALVLEGKLGLLARHKPFAAGHTPVDEDFLLTLDINPTAFSFTETDFTARCTGGEITLAPELFSKDSGGQNVPASVTFTGVLCLRYVFATKVLEFCDVSGQPFRLDFNNFRFTIPGIEDALVLVTHAQLELTTTALPVLKSLDATFQFPLPGMDASNPSQDRIVSLNLTGKDWRLDGFPKEASIALTQNLRVVDMDGMDIDLLGGTAVTGCQTVMSLTTTGAGAQQRTTLSLSGGMKLQFDNKLLTNTADGTAVSATACGSFAWDFQALPTFSLDVLQIEGAFKWGGASGLGLVGVQAGQPARIKFTGLPNLFHLTAATPFRVNLEAALDVADFIRFGLVDTAFIWDGTSLLPRVEAGGFQTDLGKEGIELADNFLPVYPTKIGLRFINPAAPLFPSAGQMGLLDPLNLQLILSGVANLPNGEAIAAGAPGIAGQVNDLVITLVKQGNLYLPHFNIDGLGLQLTNLDIPPLGGITGGIFVGNLNALSANPPRPLDVYFAGQVGAKINDVGAEVMLAMKPTEFIGACFEVNAGPAGIPLDGGTLGGILLTGASGGINFKNSFADPCDFRTYITGNTAAFPAAGSPQRPGSPPDIENMPYPAKPGPDPTQGFNCIVGDFPPPTVNPLCMPHPAIPGRIVFKGTILTEQQLQMAGITPASVPGNANQAIDFALNIFKGPVQTLTNGLLAFDPAGVSAEAKAFYRSKIREIFDSFEDAARNALQTAFQKALNQNPDRPFYEILREAAAAGIPCFDVTVKMSGTFSHAAISTVITGTGGVTMSSTGTSVLDGSINLVGIPVATGKLAFSLTNEGGDIDPAIGGIAKVALGPLELGQATMALECQGCFSKMVDAFTAFIACNAQTLEADVKEYLYAMLDRTVPLRNPVTGQKTPRSRATDISVYWNELTSPQKTAYVGSLLSVYQLAGSGRPLGIAVLPATLTKLSSCFRQFVADAFNAVDPTLCMGGAITPKLFGIPLTGGADTIVGGGAMFSRSFDQGTRQDYYNFTARTDFSPTALLMSSFSGALMAVAPPLGAASYAVTSVDQFTLGMNLRVPALSATNAQIALNNPVQFVNNQVNTFFNDAIFTSAYQLKPLGFKLANAQMRLLFPQLDSHPTRPGVNWVLPYSIPDVNIAPGRNVKFDSQHPAGNPETATRMEIILAATARDKLLDPQWRGQQGELDDLFAANIPNPTGCDTYTNEVGTRIRTAQPALTKMTQLSFAKDYFPHGGVIGGGEFSLPRVMTQLPPPEIFTLLTVPADTTGASQWLSTAQNVFTNYLAATDCIGQVGFYLPAPNPVFPQNVTWATASLNDVISGQRLAPDQLIAFFNRSLPGGLYPFDQMTLGGWMDLSLLGTPTARGYVAYDAVGKCFIAKTGIPQNSWLTKVVSADLNFQIKPPRDQEINGQRPFGVDEFFTAVKTKLQTTTPNQLLANSGKLMKDTVDVLKEQMPRVSLEATASLQLPDSVKPFLRAQGTTGFTFFAYSPLFEPAFGLGNPGPDDDDNSPFAIAKRSGGLGLKGAFDFGMNLQTPSTTDDIKISIPDASVSLSPSGAVGVFPAMAAQIKVENLTVPGMPKFSKGIVSFNSAPPNGAYFVGLEGTLEGFSFNLPPGPSGNPFFSLTPLAPATALQGKFHVVNNAGTPAAEMFIDPAKISLPFLGPNVAIYVIGNPLPPPGSTPPPQTSFVPFSFSTVPGQSWSATVCLTSANNFASPPVFSICDPFQPAGSVCSMSFTPTSRIFGRLSGVGTQTFSLELQIPNGFSATFFPGQATEVTRPVVAGATGFSTLFIDNAGRFYVDLGGPNTMGLPGVLTASGRLEFGYNPAGDGPLVTTSPAPPAFVQFPDTDLFETTTQTITVNNDGNAPASVGISTTSHDFTPNRTGLTIPVKSSRTFDVLFRPGAVGTRDATVKLETNDPARPELTVTLKAKGISVPRYFQSRSLIAFGGHAVGGVSRGSVTIGNTGSAPMTVTGVNYTGASQFTFSPGGGFTLQPNTTRLFVFEFAPDSLTSYSGALTLTVPAIPGTKKVDITGQGIVSPWMVLLDSDMTESNETLRDIDMLDGLNGWAVGDSGRILQTKDGGHSWTPRALTPMSMQSINAQSVIKTRVLAEYHFEEPENTTIYRDDGPSGFHGSSPAAGNRPFNNYNSGRFGTGLSFFNPREFGPLDNTNTDYVELGLPGLPDSFAISMWINPAITDDGQAFIGKNTSAGGNQFIAGFFNGGYHVNFLGQGFEGGTKTTGWQHILLNAVYNAAGDTTTITFRRNDVTLWTHAFPGRISTISTGKKWALGQEWDSANVSDPFYGSMDEVYFFSNSLTSNEQSALANGEGGTQLTLAGSSGTVLQSETQGRTWHLARDANTAGWRQRLDVFRNYSWFDVTRNGDGKLLLGGSRTGATVLQTLPVSLMEDAFLGGAGTADDQFDELTLPVLGGSTTKETIRGMVNARTGHMHAVTSLGRIFTGPASGTGAWTQHGTFDSANALNAVDYYVPFVGLNVGGYVAVGDNGLIVRSDNNDDPEEVVHGTTTSRLNAIAWHGLGPVVTNVPDFVVVGDNGVYMTSDDNGQGWIAEEGVLLGNNYGVDLEPVSISGPANYTVYVAGEQNRIQRFRSIQIARTPFVTYFPGELNFGILPLGESKTLPVKIRNRGKAAASLSGLAITPLGGPFSLAFGPASASLSPGEEITLQVRYRPSAESELDLGRVSITTNEPGAAVNVSLQGRCQDGDWKPVALSSGGLAVDGEVVKVVSTTVGLNASTVYAVVEAIDRSRVFRSTNSGGAWSEITPNVSAGQFHRWRGIDATPIGTTDLVVLAGELSNSSGLVDGVVLVSTNSGSTWVTRTPADGTVIGFGGAAILPDGTSSNTMAVCSTNTAGDGDVWVTENSGASWSRKTQPPSSFFAGSGVRFARTANNAANVRFGAIIAASSGSALYSRDYANEWPYNGTVGETQLNFGNTHTIRDFTFANDTSPTFVLQYAFVVGDNGHFWRWERFAGQVSPFQDAAAWTPAANQEVFGATSLESVYFANDHPVGYIAGGTKLFRSSDYGKSWDMEFDTGEGGTVHCVHAAPLLIRGWAGGSLAEKAVVWTIRQPGALTRPVLTTNDIEFFTDTPPGAPPAVKPIQIQNTGNATLFLNDVRIESPDPLSRFRLITTPPASLAGGASTNLQIEFSAQPDGIDVAALNPRAFYRFEQGFTDTTYFDHSSSHFNATAPAAVDQRGVISEDEGGRDRYLKLDGNDYVELPPIPTGGGDYSFSLWVNPSTTADGQTFVSKFLTSSDQLVFGFGGGGYRVQLGSTAFFTGGTKQTGWQHLAVTVDRLASTSQVTVYRDGEILWSQSIAASVIISNTGKGWTLGGDWDSSTVINEFLKGGVDDFLFDDRVLTAAEVTALANKSPVCGEHRAKLIINSSSETGERVVELRAVVPEVTRLSQFDTDPPGLPLVVDGVTFNNTAAFAVRSNASTSGEWAEGSLHTISAPATATATDKNDNDIQYRFAGWEHGGAATQTITATFSGAPLKARYEIISVTPPAAQLAEGVVFTPRTTAFNIQTALAGTPRGPFVRLTGGNLTVAGLVNGGFSMDGDLLIGLTKIHGHLTTSQLLIPNKTFARDRFFEMGASEWLLDMEAGDHFTLKTHPPSLKILGVDVAPEGQFSLELNPAADTYRVAVELSEDFRPIPGFLEFKQGEVSADVTFSGTTPNFAFHMNGGVRVWKLPAEFADADGWAIDTNNNLNFNTADFTISLGSLLGQSPITLVNHSPFVLKGDMTLSRQSSGAVTLSGSITEFSFHGQNMIGSTPMAASINTDAELELTGSLASGISVPLIGGGRFTVAAASGSPAFLIRAWTQPSPGVQLKLPDLKLGCTAAGFPDGILTIPALEINTNGAFNTGKIPLPSWNFDGISISRPSGGDLDDNYIKLKRTDGGTISFETKAQLPFLPGCPLHSFSLTVYGSSVSASYRGKFCVLPEKVSIGYSHTSNGAQFSGTAFDHTLYFGVKTGVRNNPSGVCILGSCP
ncbi:MAG TPA: choice-of-anchor D domain-containing protein [Verrucomicrobiales bacterium]|nr:choice-of-anchor D domain-containing protein [Verrucomicrobiales bacterium]